MPNLTLNLTEDKTSGEIDLKAQYGKGKVSTLSIEGDSSDNYVDLKIASHTPHYEKLKKFELSLQAKVIDLI